MCWWLERDPCEILPGREAVCFSGPLLSPRLRPQGRNKGHVSYMHSQSIEDLWLSEYVDMLVFLTKLWKLSLTMSEVLLLQKIKKKKILQREKETNNYTHGVLEHLGSVLCNHKNNDCSSWSLGGEISIFLLSRHFQSHLLP